MKTISYKLPKYLVNAYLYNTLSYRLEASSIENNMLIKYSVHRGSPYWIISVKIMNHILQTLPSPDVSPFGHLLKIVAQQDANKLYAALQ